MSEDVRTLTEFNNEYVIEKLEELDINDKDYAAKAKVLAELQKNAIEAERVNVNVAMEDRKLEASNVNESKKARNDLWRNVVQGAGVVVSLLAVGASFLVGRRATKNEEDYIHNNREGLQTSNRLMNFAKK